MDRVKANTNAAKYAKATLFSVLVGEVVTIIILFLISLIMSKVDIPLFLTDIMVIVASSIGAFFAGFMNGKALREKGILFGLITGGIMILILALFNLAFHELSSGFHSMIKLLLMLALSGVGGVFGVNTKSKRVKY